jgi:hypothetical protein
MCRHTYAPSSLQVVVSPHLYPASITGVPAETEDQDDEITWKWDISWGWKSLGLDKTSKVWVGAWTACRRGGAGSIAASATAWGDALYAGPGAAQLLLHTVRVAGARLRGFESPLAARLLASQSAQGEALRDVGLLIGEFGAADGGDNGVANADTTSYSARDAKWLKLLSRYLNGLSWQNGPASWMWWSWNVSHVAVGSSAGASVGAGVAWRWAGSRSWVGRGKGAGAWARSSLAVEFLQGSAPFKAALRGGKGRDGIVFIKKGDNLVRLV